MGIQIRSDYLYVCISISNDIKKLFYFSSSITMVIQINISVAMQNKFDD